MDTLGPVAQLGERLVRNEKVTSSILARSTKIDKFVVGQSHLSGFAQTSIDEASM